MTGQRASGWRPRALLACHVAAALVLASWLLPATRAWWDALDESVFRSLNDTLATGERWQTFWAWANWRQADWIPLAIMLGAFAWWIREGGRERLGRRLAAVGAYSVGLFLARDLVGVMLDDVLEWRRRSPTLLLPDVHLLHKLVPGVDAKDVSGKSFPGDHAIAFLAVATFLWVHAGRRRGLLTLLMLSPFTLPRLVGGAHWLTDILVGAVCIVLVTTGWWFATPLGERATDLGEALLRRPLAWLRLSRAGDPARAPDTSGHATRTSSTRRR